MSEFKLEQSDRLTGLDLEVKKIADATIKQEYVFLAAQDAQLSLMGKMGKIVRSFSQHGDSYTYQSPSDNS